MILAADVLFGDEKITPENDFVLTMTEISERRLPTVLSFAPADGEDLDYYALWLPPLQELAAADPLPRSLTFVIDNSSSMEGGRLRAVKGALTAAIEDLQEGDLFKVNVFNFFATAFADGPVEATRENKDAAIQFINRQSALGSTNYEAAMRTALGQVFPEERANHIIFLTDGQPTTGETDLPTLARLVDNLAGDDIRIFTIGVDSTLNRNFLIALAEDHRGTAYFFSDEDDIETALRDLFEDFTRPVFFPTQLSFVGAEIHDVHPGGVQVGENRLTWDGKDDNGRDVSSGA
jgi:uncharacterized protein YegL